jgi:NTE family protein
LLLGGCASRPVNPPIGSYDPNSSFQIQRSGPSKGSGQNLVILAFSGGGTRAAAFSYGVLETLREIELTNATGRRIRLLDEVDAITGVSGGSFTALAYGLYGEKLFDDYEKRFLKRNVQGELLGRLFNPGNWGALWFTGWGRSELAADLVRRDPVQRRDLRRLVARRRPIDRGERNRHRDGIAAGIHAFELRHPVRRPRAIRLSRAAAASSAVPVVLSPVTIDNYGGSCGYTMPPWTKLFLENPDPPRPAARILGRLAELRGYEDLTNERYLHLVDGGVSDNVGLRGVLEIVSVFETLHEAGVHTQLDDVKRIVVFVVNSLSVPSLNWNELENPPGTVPILIKAAGVPIDRYSGESIELLKDIAARWKSLRQIRDSAAFATDKDPAVAYVKNAPNADLYVIDVSFSALKDKGERAYLNQLPTTFVLPDEAVDRLRAAAKKLIVESPDFQRVLKDAGARMVPAAAGASPQPSAAAAPAAVAPR